jgi:ketosteroid isomerase-like protein
MMSVSRRSVLVAAGAGLASGEIIAGAARASDPSRSDLVTDKEIAELIQRTADANSALLRGDVVRHRALMPYTDDFTLMAPFGGKPTHASELTEERWAAMGRFFRNGRAKLEVVQVYRSTDMIVLAIVERQRIEVGGLPDQDWSLRVTLAYRREGSEWRLAHRHADPLVKGISLEQAAAIARG